MIDSDKKNNITPVVPAIEFSGVSFAYSQYQSNAIDNISFRIKKGSYVCIIGHNGSGKSTLSKLITGILKPQHGIIKINGTELRKESVTAARSQIGIVFQNPDNQFIGSTVEDDIAFGLENRNYNPTDMPEIIRKAARKVGMEKYLKSEPLSLSGGQKQRVAIAGILAINPPIIIFDEASSMLDPAGKRDLNELIFSLKANNPDKTLISITHDMNEVIAADYVIVLSHGKLFDNGTPEDIFFKYEHLEANALDLPFILKMSHYLHDKKLIDKLVMQDEDLVSQIEHQLKLKKISKSSSRSDHE